MGFRDLRAFNLAMLAKQGWRLLQEDESLLYKCFKARYFPRSNFLEASESLDCSFVWRSIMAVHISLKMGVVGGLGMVIQLEFMRIDGFQIIQPIKFYNRPVKKLMDY